MVVCCEGGVDAVPQMCVGGLGVDTLLPLSLCSEMGSPSEGALAPLSKRMARTRSAESVKRALVSLEQNGLRIS